MKVIRGALVGCFLILFLSFISSGWGAPVPPHVGEKVKSCRIESVQESTPEKEIDVASGTPLSVLNLPITAGKNQRIKFDAMVRVKLLTDDTATSYRYILQSSLIKDGVSIASANEIMADDNTAGNSRDIHHMLPLSWVDVPTEGPHVYELQVQLAPFDIKQASVLGARSLNAIICDQ